MSEPESGSVRPNAPMTSPEASFGSQWARCSSDPPTPSAPIASPPCTPANVVSEESTRDISRPHQPRKTALFSKCPDSAHSGPKMPSAAMPGISWNGISARAQ